MNIFKIEYDWYEGEHEETLLVKAVEREEFEKDLVKATEFATELIGKKIEDGDYLGKGYSVECLPEYYQQTLWFLTEKLGYMVCYFDENINYSINDSFDKKIFINKFEKKIVRSELK